MMRISQEALHIRHMEQSDFHWMVKWLSDPLVLEFYEEPPSDLERIRKKYGPRVEGTHYVTSCIVEYEDAPIGYMQYYEIQEADRIKYGYPSHQHLYGIDQFIGDTSLLGKGTGTKMIRLMLEDLRFNRKADKVLLEVKRKNERAISCYLKCGFKEVKELSQEEILMEWG